MSLPDTDIDFSIVRFFCYGFVVGVVIGLAITNKGQVTAEIANEAIAECELNLPRNQHCEISAVVAHKKGGNK